MTGPELKKQDQLFEFIKEWREDDRLWKTDVDGRLRHVEKYITTDEARNSAEDRSSKERRKHAFDHRAQIALVMTAITSVAGLVLGLIHH